MFVVLFVCTGATCRGPMADCILRDKIKSKNLKGIKSLSNAGLFVVQNSNVTTGAINALKLLNIKTKPRKPIQLTKDMIDSASLVLTMTKEQRAILESRFGKSDKVFAFSQFISGTDIGDPYGKNDSYYFKVARYIDYCVEEMLEILIREGVLKNDK